MQKRIIRWVATLVVGLALGVGLLASGAAKPQTAYGSDATPTPTAAGSNPSGGGGGH